MHVNRQVQMPTRPYMFLIESMIHRYPKQGLIYGITLLLVSSQPVNVRILAMLEVPQLPSNMQSYYMKHKILEGKILADQSLKLPTFYAANVPTLRQLGIVSQVEYTRKYNIAFLISRNKSVKGNTDHQNCITV